MDLKYCPVGLLYIVLCYIISCAAIAYIIIIIYHIHSVHNAIVS